MNKKFRFAVIGCGRMGKRRAVTVTEHPDTELVVVIDQDQDSARMLAQQYGCAHGTDVQVALHNPDIDCFIVSLPNKSHVEIVVPALKARKHVFCEKPLARNPNEAWMMVEAAREAGVTLTTGSNMRFFPNVIKAKELLEKGHIGETLFLRGWIGHKGWNLNDSWFSDAELAGGGTFLDNGIHLMDLTRYFLGEMVSCSGMVQTNLWPVQPLEDFGVGIFRSQEGKLATIQASWTDWNGYAYLEIYGAMGYLQIDSRGKACKTVLGDREGKEQIFDFTDLPSSSYTDEFVSYVSELKANHQPVPSGFDGMRVVQMAWGVYESAKSGTTINLPEQYGISCSEKVGK